MKILKETLNKIFGNGGMQEKSARKAKRRQFKDAFRKYKVDKTTGEMTYGR